MVFLKKVVIITMLMRKEIVQLLTNVRTVPMVKIYIEKQFVVHIILLNIELKVMEKLLPMKPKLKLNKSLTYLVKLSKIWHKEDLLFAKSTIVKKCGIIELKIQMMFIPKNNLQKHIVLGWLLLVIAKVTMVKVV